MCSLVCIETLAESCSSEEGTENVRPVLYHKMERSAEFLMVNAGLVSYDLDYV